MLKYKKILEAIIAAYITHALLNTTESDLIVFDNKMILSRQ